MTRGRRSRGLHSWSLLLVALLSVESIAAASIVIFDEDDGIGQSYYDASVGGFKAPSFLRLDGPGDKLKVIKDEAWSGTDSVLLQWRSAPGGDWSVLVAAPGFKIADAAPCLALSFRVNSADAVARESLPQIALESTPPDVRSKFVSLASYLPTGIDSDVASWQLARVPLTAFGRTPAFSLAAVKGVVFRQAGADDVLHTIWVDAIRLEGDDDDGRAQPTIAPAPPVELLAYAGDRSVALHWKPGDHVPGQTYHIYRKTSQASPLRRLTSTPIQETHFADLDVENSREYWYAVRAMNTVGVLSAESATVRLTPRPFADDVAFVEYLQRAAFDYFWHEANPTNGLIRDRTDRAAPCSVAAVGFGLSAIPIGIERGWVSRAEGSSRVRSALETLWNQPQSDALTGTTGHRGWFYHFLDMDSGLRFASSEVSSIDTALLLAGMLDAKQFFDRPHSDEIRIRTLADRIFQRVDWQWMLDASGALRFGWRPESGFISNRWVGYNEGMVVYLLGLGAAVAPLPPSAWAAWTGGYLWRTNYGQSYVEFGPLFGHQYTHCWVDFRTQADEYMRGKGLTYFENSRRATLAQRQYAIENPSRHPGYGANVWGWTACDGPGVVPYLPYSARGISSTIVDDGTIAPTAAASSTPFTPEFSIPAVRAFYDSYRTNLWTVYGFRDAFNLRANWWAPHVLGIDQGPILLMLENYRTGKVWRRFMRNPEIQRGLKAASFLPAETGRYASGFDSGAPQ